MTAAAVENMNLLLRPAAEVGPRLRGPRRGGGGVMGGRVYKVPAARQPSTVHGSRPGAGTEEIVHSSLCPPDWLCHCRCWIRDGSFASVQWTTVSSHHKRVLNNLETFPSCLLCNVR